MHRYSWLATVALVTVVLTSVGSPSCAAVTPSGDTVIASSSSGSTYVGYSTFGALSVDGGSTLTNSFGYVAYNSGSSGLATVSGTGSTWANNNAELYVGNLGSGELRIEAGGQASNRTGYLGRYSTSTGTATVTGAGWKWINSNSLFVGNYGSGTLRIEGGGQVSNSYAYVGYYAGSIGSVTVTGTGSTWASNNAELDVGKYGGGTLRIEAAGK